MVKALVTGGCGFVGSHLVNLLCEQGDDVVVYDKVTGGDLRDTDTLRAALRGMDVVYHFAAIATPHSKTHPLLDFRHNLLGTANLLEEMHWVEVPRIVFASSSSVYGSTTVFPTTEECAMAENQTSLYGASKLAAEALIAAYTTTFGMQATIFRFAPMLGEGYHRGHVRDFYDKLRVDPTRIEILGDGKQRRSYVYVEDAMHAVVETQACGTYNVASDATASVDESLDWICDELGVAPERVYTGNSWAGDKALTLLDTSRLRKLGWSPHVPIEEAVRRTVRSFG